MIFHDFFKFNSIKIRLRLNLDSSGSILLFQNYFHFFLINQISSFVVQELSSGKQDNSWLVNFSHYIFSKKKFLTFV